MKSKGVLNRYLVAAVSAFLMWQARAHSATPAWSGINAAADQSARQSSAERNIASRPKESGTSDPAIPKDRAASVRALVSHLGLGNGSVVADIGAGNGRDTWVFAEIVGENGTVYAEEIDEAKVRSLKESAEEKNLAQVVAMLGSATSPCLPFNSVDLVYMNRVYHHFAKPREMLREIWRSLKPKGYLVVIDQRRGTLRDWVPRHERETKHHLIAETTVVREAREEGFLFVSCVEDFWHEKDPFVLVFQRPENLRHPGRDPDRFQSFPIEKYCHLFLPSAGSYDNPVFVALGDSRQLIVPILARSNGEGLDIVLEEWATQKEERPPLPPGVLMPCVLSENGDPNLGDEPIDVVFFLDSYHLLFHGKNLLARIHEKLTPNGRVYILDRKADAEMSRRQASHRRKIRPETVKQEMKEAGFSLWFRGPRLTRDRFLMVFGKKPS